MTLDAAAHVPREVHWVLRLRAGPAVPRGRLSRRTVAVHQHGDVVGGCDRRFVPPALGPLLHAVTATLHPISKQERQIPGVVPLQVILDGSCLRFTQVIAYDVAGAAPLKPGHHRFPPGQVTMGMFTTVFVRRMVTSPLLAAACTSLADLSTRALRLSFQVTWFRARRGE